MSILYSQCWEDPQLLAGALAVKPSDDVLSIASAGDNSFALLLDGPQTLTAVDSNPEQLYLIELKMAATRLAYEDFVQFLGVRDSRDRMEMYRAVRFDLSLAARRYWDSHTRELRRGVIHCGRLESYLASFRRWLLPLIHRQTLVCDLLTAEGTAEQKQLYQERWDKRRWQWLFRLFFSQKIMSRFGRHPAWFSQVTSTDLGGTLLERTRLGMTQVPTASNYFLEYMLTGTYRNLSCAPPYLCHANFQTLQARVNQMQLQCCTLDEVLKQAAAGAYSCFNLSDVFKYMTPEDADTTWHNVVRAARPGSRLAYRTLFVGRRPPAQLEHRLSRLHGDHCCRRQDTTFFYDDFLALEVGPGV